MNYDHYFQNVRWQPEKKQRPPTEQQTEVFCAALAHNVSQIGLEYRLHAGAGYPNPPEWPAPGGLCRQCVCEIKGTPIAIPIDQISGKFLPYTFHSLECALEWCYACNSPVVAARYAMNLHWFARKYLGVRAPIKRAVPSSRLKIFGGDLTHEQAAAKETSNLIPSLVKLPPFITAQMLYQEQGCSQAGNEKAFLRFEVPRGSKSAPVPPNHPDPPTPKAAFETFLSTGVIPPPPSPAARPNSKKAHPQKINTSAWRSKASKHTNAKTQNTLFRNS